MKIYIAEKPSLGRKVAIALNGGKESGDFVESGGFIQGGGWRVCFCRGHILEMYEPQDYKSEWKKWNYDDLPISPSSWKMKEKEGVKHLLQIIKNSLELASEVINVGDADRAGQLIIDEVLEFLEWGGITKRLWLTDQSQGYINKNIDNTKDNSDYVGLKNKALARSRSDWLIGMNASRAYSLSAKKNGVDKILPIGRVQTPTLGIIKRRHDEIINFISQSYYEINATLEYRDAKCEAKLEIPEKNLNDKNQLLDRKIAESLKDNIQELGIVKDHQEKNKKSKNPLCFAKAELVEVVYKKHGYTGEETLKIIQKLYDKYGLITYPRTDCGYLPMAEHSAAPFVLENLKLISGFEGLVKKAKPEFISRTWNDEKITAHDGLRPTLGVMEDVYKSLTEREKNVFNIIAVRYISQFYEEYSYNETTFTVEAGEYKLKTKGIATTKLGWVEVYPDEAKKAKSVPNLSDGLEMKISAGEVKEKKTTAPKYFNDGNIEKVMKNISRYTADEDAKKILSENEGIGEESTRSSIVELLKKREHIFSVKGDLKPTENGIALINAIKGDIKSPIKTAIMERDLVEIEKGNLSLEDYLKDQLSEVAKIVVVASQAVFEGFAAEAGQSKERCPKCSDGYISRKKGANAAFWPCSGCNAAYEDLGGKAYIKAFRCPCDKGGLKLLNGQYGQYFKCETCSLKYNCKRNKPEFEKIEKGVLCPNCKSHLLQKKSKAKKDYFPCSSKECNFVAFKSKSGYTYKKDDKYIELR